MTFNSLYEIRRYKWSYKYFSTILSILFMRFLWKLEHYNYAWNTLSILFMRFTKGRRNSFESSTSIFQFSLWDSLSDFDPSGEEIYNFQFSLWDSSYMKTILLCSYILFQFSLWDSKYFLIKYFANLFLSILFMRFKEFGQLFDNVYIYFQFSLWDSVQDARILVLHLLNFQFSLWDSLVLGTLDKYLVLNFQFSLWDSWNFNIIMPCCAITFNSLYEIQKKKSDLPPIFDTFNSLYEILQFLVKLLVM